MLNHHQLERVLVMLAPMYDSDVTQLIHDHTIDYLNDLPTIPGEDPEAKHKRFRASVKAYADRVISDATRVFSQPYVENATMAYVMMRQIEKVLGATAAEFEENLRNLNKELKQNDRGNYDNRRAV